MMLIADLPGAGRPLLVDDDCRLEAREHVAAGFLTDVREACA